jgi:hypothetical protein
MQRKAGSSAPALALGALVALAVSLSGCGGGGDDYHNTLRPPAPINITAYISNQRVAVSPRRFGAGPIAVIITNQSDASQELTFETHELGGSKPGITQSTSPINPGDTAELHVNAPSGTYQVRTSDDAIEPATLVVGAKRQSAQNEVLQP